MEHPPDIRADIRGQISVMISVMMATFILFFAFVINTGMLVNAKINIQNAADLAAYAGASVQARQLTHISYLNYEMRRQWKKFLYRLYVLGNAGYESFPTNDGKFRGQMEYKPKLGGKDFGVPTTCIDLGQNTCHMEALPAIRIPPANFMDPITDALRGQLQAIEAMRKSNCQQMGMTNLILNTYWLYNTDPNLRALVSQGSATGLSGTQAQSIRLITNRALGLGIVPKEILLKMRIRTLEKYVNTRAQLGLTASKLRDLTANNTTAPAYERSISAYNSAYYTLGNFTFNGGSIVLDELLPVQILSLKPISKSFDTYAIDFEDSSGTDTTCIPVVYSVGVKTPLILGFYKDPKILTYYAVRLKAQAQILFSPFGPINLQAYSVAQPFGSRIGPNDSEVGFTFQGGPNRGGIPSLSVQEGDPSEVTSNRGWNTRDMISTLARGSGLRGGAGASTLDLRIGYRLAMTPNPWEAKRYNIINDLGTDAFMKGNFENSENAASFWAPLSADGQNTDEMNGEIKAAISEIAPDKAGNPGLATSGNFGVAGNIISALTSGLIAYVGALQEGRGETKEGFFEGFNVIKISNTYPDFPSQPALGRDSVFTVEPAKIKTSWNQVKNASYAAQGRVGYSVKFVSFSSIAKNPTSNDGNAAMNGPSSIGDGGLDDQVFPFIKH